MNKKRQTLNLPEDHVVVSVKTAVPEHTPSSVTKMMIVQLTVSLPTFPPKSTHPSSVSQSQK